MQIRKKEEIHRYLKSLIKLYPSYVSIFDSTYVPTRIGWSSASVMTPHEARKFAKILLDVADEVEELESIKSISREKL